MVRTIAIGTQDGCTGSTKSHFAAYRDRITEPGLFQTTDYFGLVQYSMRNYTKVYELEQLSSPAFSLR
jgi:hypothetical protein